MTWDIFLSIDVFLKLDTIAEIKEVDRTLSFGFILQALVIGPRSASKVFSSWFKDCLVKQGLKMPNAEALLR